MLPRLSSSKGVDRNFTSVNLPLFYFSSLNPAYLQFANSSGYLTMLHLTTLCSMEDHCVLDNAIHGEERGDTRLHVIQCAKLFRHSGSVVMGEQHTFHTHRADVNGIFKH